MKSAKTAATLLRIYLGEREQYATRPLYQAIVDAALAHHMAGATVLRGPLGYGHSAHLHRASFLDIAENLPLVVEIVDRADKIDAFLPVIDAMISTGLVTLESVQAFSYGDSPLGDGPAAHS